MATWLGGDTQPHVHAIEFSNQNLQLEYLDVESLDTHTVCQHSSETLESSHKSSCCILCVRSSIFFLILSHRDARGLYYSPTQGVRLYFTPEIQSSLFCIRSYEPVLPSVLQALAYPQSEPSYLTLRQRVLLASHMLHADGVTTENTKLEPRTCDVRPKTDTRGVPRCVMDTRRVVGFRLRGRTPGCTDSSYHGCIAKRHSLNGVIRPRTDRAIMSSAYVCTIKEYPDKIRYLRSCLFGMACASKTPSTVKSRSVGAEPDEFPESTRMQLVVLDKIRDVRL